MVIGLLLALTVTADFHVEEPALVPLASADTEDYGTGMMALLLITTSLPIGMGANLVWLFVRIANLKGSLPPAR